VTIPSRVLASGVNSMSTVAICGDGGIALSASGTTQSDAYQLNRVHNDISTCAIGAGVKLPITEEGEIIYIANSSGNSLKVYPYESTSVIDGGSYVSVNPGYSILLFAVTRSAWRALMGAGSPAAATHYGSFYDTTTQSAAAINTAYAITFNNTDISNGVSRGTPTSRIVVAYAGTYNFQFSAQVDKASGATAHINFWIRKNGVDVPYTAGIIAVQGTSAESVPAWNYLISLAANDYVQLMYSVNDTNLQITASAASAPVPAIPSVILTVTQVNSI
jgi:hypothetical protein